MPWDRCWALRASRRERAHQSISAIPSASSTLARGELPDEVREPSPRGPAPGPTRRFVSMIRMLTVVCW